MVKRRNWKKDIVSKSAAGFLAAVMACSFPMVSLAETADGQETSAAAETSAEQEASASQETSASQTEAGGQTAPVSDNLTGDTIEYDQLDQWIRQYNPVIKSANEAYYIQAEDAMDVAEQLRDKANELYDEAKDLEDIGTDEAKESAKALRKTVRELRKYAKDQQDASEEMDESYTSGRSQLNHTQDVMTYNAQMLVNTYWQLQSQRTAVAKNAEAAQAALDASNALAAQGMAVESGLLASANSLNSAKATLTALDSSIESVKRNIYTLTGQAYTSGIKIGAVPAADPGRLDGIDVEKDCEAAVGNNYELIQQRHTDAETRTNKAVKSRLRGIEDAEAQMKITVRGLYQDMMSQKAAYDAARSAYESAQITWRGAQIQNQQGMLSRAEFLQAEAAFLQAQSDYQVADLELFQAMETYDWAVAGLVVTDSEQ